MYERADETREGDEEALFHLLTFLRSLFALSDEDFSDENINIEEDRFPLVWFNHEQRHFKPLLKATARGGKIKEPITVGFLYTHQWLFRTYKEHLDEDVAAPDELKQFFTKIERDFFGTKDQLH